MAFANTSVTVQAEGPTILIMTHKLAPRDRQNRNIFAASSSLGDCPMAHELVFDIPINLLIAQG